MSPTPDPQDANAALVAAFARLLAPLAQLAVARGVPFSLLDEMLRGAVVGAAHAAHPGLPEHRRTSRVSAATGLNRREVNRLLARQRDVALRDAPAPRSPAAMVFAHWRSHAAYRTVAGKPRVLPRTGPAPSFESLAQDVTRDVHPRALLEELLRLQLAVHDTRRDTVALVENSFVPHGDPQRMAQWMGANVGDHLAGAVANLLGRERAHPEQAIAADGLSADSVAQVMARLPAHWKRMTDDLVPLLEALIAADAAAPPSARAHRVRIGLYGFDAEVAPAPTTEPVPARGAAKTPQTKTTSRKGSAK